MVTTIGQTASLAGLRGPGESTSVEEKIRASSLEFERILLRQMLREVRASSLVDSSSESKAYMDISDDRMAGFLAESGGLGFGKAMAEQFIRQLEMSRTAMSPKSD